MARTTFTWLRQHPGLSTTLIILSAVAALFLLFFVANLIQLYLLGLPAVGVTVLDCAIALFIGVSFGRWMAQRHMGK